MEILKMIMEYIDYIIVGMMITILLLLIILISLGVSQRKLKKKYKKLMEGSNGKSLEKQIFTSLSEIERIKANIDVMNDSIHNLEENMLTSFQKMGVVKYDAFNEMGGKLSFVLALLDKNNNGYLLNSVHSTKEGCYTYLKEIINGQSFLELSADEKQALEMAINKDNFME